MQKKSVIVFIVMGLILSAPVFALDKLVSETEGSFYEALPHDILVDELQSKETNVDIDKTNNDENILNNSEDVLSKTKLEFKEVYNYNNDNNEDVVSSETINLDEEKVEEEKKSLPVYIEPFFETSLFHLEQNLNSLKELYTFNLHNNELALAISLAKNKENHVNRGCYEVINLTQLAPYKFIATLNVATELLLIAEEVKLDIVKKTSEQLTAQNSNLSLKNSILNQLQNDFHTVNDIKNICIKIINDSSGFMNKLIKAQNQNTIYNSPMHIFRPFNERMFGIVNELIDSSNEISDLYDNNYEYCNELLDYAFSEPASIKNAVVLSRISSSLYEFINVLKENNSIFLRAVMSIDLEIKKIREELNKSININLKKADVIKKLNYYPGYIKTVSSEKGLHVINFVDEIHTMFDLLNKLCDSELLKDKLSSEDNINQKRLERIERSNNLLNELLPYIDSNNTSIIEDYGLLFESNDLQNIDKQNSK